jgi:predicted regulator of Ras-like GTPase activity (Roadblock/LC7/MglB family)
MSDIPARLEVLLDRIDGALAASLVAADGIPVATAKRDGGFDLEALAAELLTQVRAISDEQRDLAVGEVDQYSVSTDRFTILIGLLQAGYYLLLVLGRESSYGRARFEMRRARLLFEDDLG